MRTIKAHTPSDWVGTAVRRFSAPALAVLLVVAPLGNARGGAAGVTPPPCLSFRSLPALRSAQAGAVSDRPRLVSFSPADFGPGNGLLWQTPESGDTATPLPAAERAIRDATRKALTLLKAGDAAGYAAVLAPDYAQTDSSGLSRGKDDVLRSLRANLTTHTFTAADFDIADLRLVTPTEAAVTMTQRLDTLTRDTPPTVYPAWGGRVAFVQNNAVTTRTVTVSRQTWAKRGVGWVLVRSQKVDEVTTAIA